MNNIKPILSYKWAIPIGLLISSGSLMLRFFVSVPDFVSGILQGVAVGIMLVALVKKRRTGCRYAE
ncbi:MAG: hypothetical protein H0X33_03440 [Taibaiella sp.]|nr:hypothetical protein [Taibaiella sp.]